MTTEDQIFVAALVRCHGSIKQMEEYFGVSFSNLNPETLDQLVEGLSDLTVNVDAVKEGETAKVRVFCE